MSQLHENQSVEKKVTEWLAQTGWAYRSAEDLKRYNRLQTSAVIEPILVDKVKALNHISQQAAKSAVEILLNNLRNPISIDGNEKLLSQLTDGVTMTLDKAVQALVKLNISEVEALGKPFDPNTMHAVQQVPAGEGQESGTVSLVFQKGYFLGEKLVRPATVVVFE